MRALTHEPSSTDPGEEAQLAGGACRPHQEGVAWAARSQDARAQPVRYLGVQPVCARRRKSALDLPEACE